MEKLKEKLWAELEEIADKKELSAGDLEMAHKLTDTIKNIDKICMLEDGGYSQDGEGGGNSYARGNSYANRGQHYVRGHYSRDGQGNSQDDGYSGRRMRGGHSRRGYSQDDGRSEMMEHLEMALDSATEEDREDIKRFMKKLKNA